MIGTYCSKPSTRPQRQFLKRTEASFSYWEAERAETVQAQAEKAQGNLVWSYNGTVCPESLSSVHPM